MKTPSFPIIPDFTPTKFSTNQDKQDFARQFIRFIESGFNQSLFFYWFYCQMSMMRGHIAHYDRSGFYDAQFGTEEARKEFLKHWLSATIYGDPAFTYSDVEMFLAKWLKHNIFLDTKNNLMYA